MMTALDLAGTTGSAAPVAPILVSVFALIALYVWTALALSAVFRKSGEEGWKAWVPVLNLVILLQLGGLSGWFVLLALVPVLGALALWVVQIIACYRINLAFGHGAGMTVLAALLFPVWATVLGFGSARWVGSDAAVGVRRSPSEPGARLAGYDPADAGPPPPLPSAPPAAASVAGWAPATTPTRRNPQPPPLPPAPLTSPVPGAAADPFVPPPAYAPDAAVVPGSAGPDDPAIEQTSAPAAPTGRRRSDPAPEPISSVPEMDPPAPAAPAVPPPAFEETPSAAAPAPASSARANQGWGGFDLGAVAELTSEVTAAVSGAPRPVSAVSADAGSTPPPAVTRVPSARRTTPSEPWAPARSPLPEPDAFPEASGEVSAVVGAPNAGIPRSARSSVSAQHVLPEVPDDVEATVVASRRKAHWSLILPTGTPVALSADVVLVGRRPAPSTAYPNAQLVEVHDGTVSKTHLRLERHGDEWSVTDLQSTNGTILIASDGSERDIVPGSPHRAPGRLLIGDAEVLLTADDAGR